MLAAKIRAAVRQRAFLIVVMKVKKCVRWSNPEFYFTTIFYSPCSGKCHKSIFSLQPLQMCVGQHQPFAAGFVKIDLYARMFAAAFVAQDDAFAEALVFDALA